MITGVEGQAFTEDHQNGYGPEVFGAQGPISEFRVALDTIQSADGLLDVSFNRGMSSQNVTLDVGTVYWEYLANLSGQLPEIYSHPCRIANLPANFSIE